MNTLKKIDFALQFALFSYYSVTLYKRYSVGTTALCDWPFLTGAFLLKFRHHTEVSDHIHSTAAIAPGKESLVPFKWEAVRERGN